MTRALRSLVVLTAVATALALAWSPWSDGSGSRYTIELDNAFGLVEGGDLKVAGVRAGIITGVRLDTRTSHALVDIRIDDEGFGSLREDVRCVLRPQSLLGEYFIDCQPGTANRALPKGAMIPVERTESTVPPDLVTSIMRRPYRERLRILLGELGAGAAGNAENLNAAIRRMVPALRETDRVLAALGTESRALSRLARDAERVVGDLAENRGDVARFVTEAGDTTRVSAARRTELASALRRLPGFLRELTGTMGALGEVAGRGTPAARNLAASAGELERLLQNVPPLADAARPALAKLGEAAAAGRPAVRGATPSVQELDRAAAGMPELSRNIAIILEHLDDRDNAVERDPRSPGGQGYTGLEAALQYVFDQTLAINVFDGEFHLLKGALFESRCAPYTEVEQLRRNPSLEDCASRLGPTQPGITHPDPTAPTTSEEQPRRRGARRGQAHRPAPLTAQTTLLDYLLAP